MDIVNFIKKIKTINSGKLTKIAILDTGTNSHPDLQKNGLFNKSKVISSKIYEDMNLSVFNSNSDHGAKVSSVISALNDKFSFGLASDASYIPVRIYNGDKKAEMGKRIVEALNYCLTLEIDVINISLLVLDDFYIQELNDVIYKLYLKNIPIVCASGNSSEKVTHCLGVNNLTLCVGAGNIENLTIAKYSNWGENVAFLAPYENYLTISRENYYRLSSGTSYSSSFISGIISVIITELKTKNIKYKIEDIITILTSSCVATKDLEGKSKYGIICPEKLYNNLLKI